MDGQQTGILTPEMLISWKRESGFLKIPHDPKTIILCPQSFLIKPYLGWNSKKLKGISGTHVCVNAKKGLYLSTGWGIGSPALMTACEEFRALGANRFILIGLSGRLKSDLPEGSVWLIDKALIDEGTSRNYGQEGIGGIVSGQFSEFTDNLKYYLTSAAMTVSTDAVFRETPAKIAQWKKYGASLIDMETSALFSFSNFYNLQSSSILVGADLLDGNWSHPKKMDEVNKQLIATLKLVIQIIDNE